MIYGRWTGNEAVRLMSLSGVKGVRRSMDHGEYPPAYMGSEDASGTAVSTAGRSSDHYPPGPRYQEHHASVHKPGLSTGGLTNR